MSDSTEQTMIDFLKENEGVSSKEIHEAMSSSISYSTVKRVLTKLNTQNFVITKGQKKAALLALYNLKIVWLALLL
jgi:predicted transcriptional regulator